MPFFVHIQIAPRTYGYSSPKKSILLGVDSSPSEDIQESPPFLPPKDIMIEVIIALLEEPEFLKSLLRCVAPQWLMFTQMAISL